MCSFWDILKSGWLDNRTQRKRNRVSCALMLLSLLIFIGVNSTVNSVNKGVQDVLYGLHARVLTTYYDTKYDAERYRDLDECMSSIEESLKADERITDVFLQIGDTVVLWKNTSDYFKANQVEVVLNTFFDSVLEYTEDENLKAPAYDEVIIPKYFYGVGMYDNYNCYDGEELVGKSIHITYQSWESDNCIDYDLKVIGTYDNIAARSAQCVLFVNPEVGKEIVDFDYEEEKANEEAYRAEMEAMGMEDVEYEVLHQYRIGIAITKDCDIQELRNELSSEKKLNTIENIILDDELQGYFKYIIFVANIVSFMLLCIAVVNIVISSLNEVKDRKWEYALKMSMGYKRRDVVMIFFFEKLLNLVNALAIALVVLVIYSGIATYAVRNIMPFWMKNYVIAVDLKSVAVGCVLVVVSALIGVLAARLSIQSIGVAETLKSGD